jgi:hypothetical protein
MDELKGIERLAALARHEPAPTPDVAEAVLARLRLREETPAAPLAWFAAGSALAAAAVLVMALRAWAAWSDPLVELFHFVPTVMQ